MAVISTKMAAAVTTPSNIPESETTENCEEVDKMLMVVVKRRKTIPTKCMEINKEIASYELLRLEKAKIITEDCKEKEKFKQTIQGLKKLKYFEFTLDDMKEAEEKLEKYSKRTKQINCYLEKRKKLLLK